MSPYHRWPVGAGRAIDEGDDERWFIGVIHGPAHLTAPRRHQNAPGFGTYFAAHNRGVL